MPSLHWHCWLGVRQSFRPEKKFEWRGVGVVICLERGADCLLMVQLVPLPFPSPIMWCYLSGTDLPRLSRKRGFKRVCVFCSILAQDLGTPEGSAGLSKCGEGRVWHNAVFGSRYKPTRWLEWADQAGQKHTPLHHTKNVLLLLSLRSCIKPLLTSRCDCELSKTAGARYSTV